jgi:uncharacterized Zn-finger protein
MIRDAVAPDLSGGPQPAISPTTTAAEDIAMPIAPPETEIVTAHRVACDGGEGALGHPRVWLSIPPDRGWVECGYCDKKFIHADVADKAASAD